MVKKNILFIIFYVIFFDVIAQNKGKVWVDSIFHTLSAEQKISQLLMVRITDYEEKKHVQNQLITMKQLAPGGILIDSEDAIVKARWIDRLQHIANVPLIVGVSTTANLFHTSHISNEQILGAIGNDSLLLATGKEIGRQMNMIGIHWLFSTNKKNMSEQSSKGEHNKTHPAVENAKQLIKEGLTDENVNILISKSNYIWKKDIPRQATPCQRSMKIFTSTHHYVPNELSVAYLNRHHGHNQCTPHAIEVALEKGCDLIVVHDSIALILKKIKQLIKKKRKLKKQLYASVKKVLHTKYILQQTHQKAISPDYLIQHINTERSHAISMRNLEHAITIVKNNQGILPIQSLERYTYSSLSIGEGRSKSFQDYLSKYVPFTHYTIKKLDDTLSISMPKKSNIVVIALYAIQPNLKDKIRRWIEKLSHTNSVIVCAFTNTDDLSYFENLPTLVTSYTDQWEMPSLTAQTLFGVYEGKGVLPYSISATLQAGLNNPFKKLNRLGYSIPAMVGMDKNTLDNIDDILQEALDSIAAPGYSILAIRKGKVVFERNTGWKTYKKQEPITWRTIFDLASITKVAATLQAIMYMHDKQMIDINKKASVYLPHLAFTNKKNCVIKDILTHQAGLWPYIPYWKRTLSSDSIKATYYKTKQTSTYSLPVAKDMYGISSLKDSLWRWTLDAPLIKKTPKTPHGYRYSDMGYYLLFRMAEKILQKPLEEFLETSFYKPIGAYTLGYLPLNRFTSNQIAPTEYDSVFRKCLLRGYVHDPGAAMYGGIAGHAGLFGNANDLAKIGQLWLQKGNYSNRTYITPTTIDYFTNQHYKSNRRGIGWDRPAYDLWHGPTSLYASPQTFGHTGFTGTALWIDPAFDLIYVFLSNRIYPDVNNTKLLSLNIRTRIQSIIYKSIFNYCKQNGN